MKFKLVESLTEEYYYKVKYGYTDNSSGKPKYLTDYVFAIGPENVSSSDVLSVDLRHEKANLDLLPDNYDILEIKPTSRNRALMKPSKLFHLTNRSLRYRSNKTVSKDDSIQNLMNDFDFNGNDGADKLISHHLNGNELITTDKRFIMAIPYSSDDSISKMVANTLHQCFEQNLISTSGKSEFTYPVYVWNDSSKKYEQEDVTVSVS